MTWTPVGSFLQAAANPGPGTISLNNQAVGNLILIAAAVDSTSNWVNSVTGGGATWSQVGVKFTGTTNARIITLWAGTVTATGAQTATLGITGGAPDIRAAGGEFHSSVGSWALDGSQANLDGSGTATWPSLTPSGSGELYFGFAIDSNSAVAGSTSGYTYNVTAQGNGAAWNPGVSAASAPAWGDSTQIFGSMILMQESGGGSTNANAGDATGTGAADGASAGVGDNAGDATGTGAALAASAAPGVSAGDATGTGSGLSASASVLVPAGLAGGTGAALAGVPGISVPGGVAGGDGAALGATVTSSATAAPAGLAAGSGAALGATAGLPAVVKQGSWWGLVSVLRHAESEFDAYRSMVPMACPNDGEPLINAPAAMSASGVERFCKFDGWSYPRDWTPPNRAGAR